MMTPTLLKTGCRLLLMMSLMAPVACGVKGPPEPPLPNEASVKKLPTDTVATPEAETRPAPVIFPVKKEVAPNNKDKSTKKK